MTTEATNPAAPPTSIQPPPVAPLAPPPAVVQPAAAQPQAPAPQAAQPSAEPKDGEDPEWLRKRIERAKATAEKTLLASLGVEKPDEAKAAIEAARAAAEARKSVEQKAIETEQKFTALQKENEELSAVIGTNAKAAMAGLTSEQREAVKALAGDSPARQLSTIDVLRPTWKATSDAAETAAKTAAEAAAKAAADAAKAGQPPTKQPLPPPAVTAPPPGAPPQTPPPAQVDHLAVYEALRKDPLQKMTAAAYFAKFQTAIVTAQRNRAAAQPQ